VPHTPFFLIRFDSAAHITNDDEPNVEGMHFSLSIKHAPMSRKQTSHQLLYHASPAPLYPTNDGSSLLAVRFPSPVRLSSVRITPEGVDSPTGPGCVAASPRRSEEPDAASRADDDVSQRDVPGRSCARLPDRHAGRGEWPALSV
jgi:hypothetical protein